MSTYLKKDGEWIKTSRVYVKVNGAWTRYTEEQFSAFTSDKAFTYGGFIDGEHTLFIAGIGSVTGESYTLAALYDNLVIPSTSCTWTIVSGGFYATIDTAGTITILSTANGNNVTVRVAYSGLTAEKTITLTYRSGTTVETETEVVTDASGNTTTTTTTTIENEDGSSSVEETVVITDESGNTVGSQESTVNTNSDGSYDSTSTNYDAEGNPTETTNESGDTEGNVNTQGIEYNESGDPVVTAYTIDTSDNPDGSKTYNGDGTNTDYYAFDLTHGFVLNIHFTIPFTSQPPNQNQNHHQILTMKRATPEPWYGFQLRQSQSNRYIQLGTQFSGGGNTNTTINSAATASANTGEYDLTITYNPTASTRCFVCHNNLTNTDVYASNYKFPDIPELRYLKVTIGYGVDENNNPYRYSNINVINFSIVRTE